jgi:RNA polymerase sigma-70 factor, ECF subfamily
MAETVAVSVDLRGTPVTAFEGLVVRELAAAYRTATLILGDPSEAEDATQDAFIRAWQRWSGLRDQERAGGWFGRILVNVCRDRLRARRSSGLRWLASEPIATAAEPSEREALWQALGDLSADHRIVIVLRYYLDLSLESIAERTGVPIGTVKSRLHHALGAIRAIYEAQERMTELEQ